MRLTSHRSPWQTTALPMSGGVPLSDYPVALLTRRTFGQMTAEILDGRDGAPCPVAVPGARSAASFTLPTRRPPC